MKKIFMQKRCWWVVAVLVNTCLTTGAQVADNTSTFKTIESDRYFRFHYDNDYFTKMDQYYTQGINLEYVHPAIKKFLPAKWLLQPANSDIKYGLTIDHLAYTPTSIRSNQVLYGDRPFSAQLSLKIFSIANDSARHRRISAALIAGIIGPAAFGKEMQTSIHRWLHNPLPTGWQYQVQNDVILNYQVSYEQQLATWQNIFVLSSTAEMRLGTLNDKLSAGFSCMAGHFNNPYTPKANHAKRFQYYLYAHPQLSVVGYDATLQGGLFNHNSPYTIPAGDISRITFQGDAGIVVSTRKLYLEYCQSILTKEFSTGQYHRWGGIRIGLSL